MQLYSWNVNGIRAAERKGFIDWLVQSQADIVGLQETKAHAEQLSSSLLEVDGYYAYFSTPEKKGYSGVALYTREQPISVAYSFGFPNYDSEGRVIIAEYQDFFFYTVYFPNGKRSAERLAYKMDFYRDFQTHIAQQREKYPDKAIVICGDVNTAHTEIDLARPKQNEKISGFLPKERSWISSFLEDGFVDCFRQYNQDADEYTWWSLRANSRARNVGWRIDYFFIDAESLQALDAAQHHTEVMGSDHCPISITFRPNDAR